jgi:6-phosphogluconolactonase
VEDTGHEGAWWAWIGSFTSAGGRGITAARVGPDGALTCVHHTGAEVPDPSYLALGSGLLHAVCERDEGAVAVLSLAEPGRPALLGPPVPVDGSGPTHLALTGRMLVTANYTSGSVSALALGADNTPHGPPRVHPHRGSGPVPGRQEGPHAHAVVPAPSGHWLLAADLGTDSVYVYAAGPGAALRPHGRTRFPAGSGPRHLVFHPDGSAVYVVSELHPTVTACRWDDREGVLEPVGHVRLVPEGATGECYPSEVVVAPDGRFAWAAVRGHDSVAVLSLGAAGEVPQLEGSVPCGGHWPRDLALHPSGRWLYAANERSGDITWFALDPVTGTPHRAGAVGAPAASCVVLGRARG